MDENLVYLCQFSVKILQNFGFHTRSGVRDIFKTLRGARDKYPNHRGVPAINPRINVT